MNVDLIEPIDVEIEQIDKGATPYPDGMSGRKFPANNVVRSAKVTIQAQVVHGDRDQKGNPVMIGVHEERKGYIVIRYEDMTNLGITLKRGDKIVKMGQLDCELFLTISAGDPAAHIAGVFNLVRMFFSDRNPTGE